MDLKTEYYDLGLLHRNETKDQVTVDAANATRRRGVAVKCATITPNRQRMEEYPQLTQMWKSPNGTIRSILDGTVFRAPIMVNGISPVVKNWKKPITIARHAYGDVYKAVDMVTECPAGHRHPGVHRGGRRGEGPSPFRRSASVPAVWQGQHNKETIRCLRPLCFQYAIDSGRTCGSPPRTPSPRSTTERFKRTSSRRSYETTYKAEFEKLGLSYFYTLIDDAVARVIRSKGGFIWACKNYDGDVMSDMVSTAFGSLAMMTSVLVSPGRHHGTRRPLLPFGDRPVRHMQGLGQLLLGHILFFPGCCDQRPGLCPIHTSSPGASISNPACSHNKRCVEPPRFRRGAVSFGRVFPPHGCSPPRCSRSTRITRFMPSVRYLLRWRTRK